MKTTAPLRSIVSLALAVSVSVSVSGAGLPFSAPAGIRPASFALASPVEPPIESLEESFAESGLDASHDSSVLSEELEAIMSGGYEVAQRKGKGGGGSGGASRATGRSRTGGAKGKHSNRSGDGETYDMSNLRDDSRKPKGDPMMARARSLASAGQFQDASRLLFQMSRMSKYQQDFAQIKYILGLMLFEMKFYQSAAFVFYDVIRQESRANPKSKYLRQSLEKLALAADMLNSDVLLRYAIKQIKEDEFPNASRDMLYYRLGEIRMQEKDFPSATREFVKVRQDSPFFYKARYKLAVALSEAGALDKAMLAFDDLAEQTKHLGITNVNRVSALLGRARVLYQKQQFDAAIEAYRQIPRDTEQWHEALFESSWAMLRDGRFRSVLSNFHSLHSAYYEDFYQPESLFLRAIVYLYICKYDEMDRVIGLFERIYKPVRRDVKTILTSVNEPVVYYREMARIQERFDKLKASDQAGRRGFRIPFLVARQVLKEGDVRRTFSYLQNLDGERQRLVLMPENWKKHGVGLYLKRILEKRTLEAQAFAGRQIRHHLALIQDELSDLFEQTGFLRFEGLSSRKESIRKEIAGKGLEKTRVDENQNRNYYVQNGYEYWPFTGEYWLDEIGNYHYVGVKACE